VRERIGARPDTRIAIYVGGLAPDRGIEQLIEAAARIDGLEVVLLGPGNDRFLPALERQAAELGVQSRLHVLDAVPPERVVAEATGADVGLVANLHSGLNHQLTVPNRIYTCLAAGVPVVANDSPAFGHIVREHELGAVCDFGDPAAVADGIRFVLDNHERLRANALRFSERESWEREAERLVELYEG
jgi:glycosyltransferase involved in cell wall biosynthesis